MRAMRSLRSRVADWISLICGVSFAHRLAARLLKEGIGVAQIAAGAARGPAGGAGAVLRPRVVRAARRPRWQAARRRRALLIRRRLPVATTRRCPLGRLLRIAARRSARLDARACALVAGLLRLLRVRLRLLIGLAAFVSSDSIVSRALVALLVAALSARARPRLPQSSETVARHGVCVPMQTDSAVQGSGVLDW